MSRISVDGFILQCYGIPAKRRRVPNAGVPEMLSPLRVEENLAQSGSEIIVVTQLAVQPVP
jgi:hypothetical protein